MQFRKQGDIDSDVKNGCFAVVCLTSFFWFSYAILPDKSKQFCF